MKELEFLKKRLLLKFKSLKKIKNKEKNFIKCAIK